MLEGYANDDEEEFPGGVSRDGFVVCCGTNGRMTRLREVLADDGSDDDDESMGRLHRGRPYNSDSDSEGAGHGRNLYGRDGGYRLEESSEDEDEKYDRMRKYERELALEEGQSAPVDRVWDDLAERYGKFYITHEFSSEQVQYVSANDIVEYGEAESDDEETRKKFSWLTKSPDDGGVVGAREGDSTYNIVIQREGLGTKVELMVGSSLLLEPGALMYVLNTLFSEDDFGQGFRVLTAYVLVGKGVQSEKSSPQYIQVGTRAALRAIQGMDRVDIILRSSHFRARRALVATSNSVAMINQEGNLITREEATKKRAIPPPVMQDVHDKTEHMELDVLLVFMACARHLSMTQDGKAFIHMHKTPLDKYAYLDALAAFLRQEYDLKVTDEMIMLAPQYLNPRVIQKL